jgi:diguanylate cyclase (GGDEF)-like protein
MAPDYRDQTEPFLPRESLFRKKLNELRRTGEMAAAPQIDSQPRSREIERNSYLDNFVASVAQKAEPPQNLERTALLDDLTELYNHNTIVRILKDEVKRARRYKMSMSVLMLTVDGFPEIEAKHGQVVSDSVLKGVSNFVLGMVRDVDIPARFDAETLLVICPNTDATGISVLSERIRSRIPTNRVSDIGQNWNVTVSIGTAAYPVAGVKDDDLIQAVQQALLAALNQGGNRCVTANT